VIFRTDDPIRDFHRWDAQQTKEEEKYPLCEMCGRRIYDDTYYRIFGNDICKSCVESCELDNVDWEEF